MQIESLFQLGGIAPIPAEVTAPTPELAPEFGNLLELALTTPPDGLPPDLGRPPSAVPPDEGPPDRPVINSIEEANLELPTADQTNPLDLPIEEPPIQRPLSQCDKEFAQADSMAMSMVYAQMVQTGPLTAVPTQPSPDEIAPSESEPLRIQSTGVVYDDPEELDTAPKNTADEPPIFAPSPEFPEFATVDSPALQVAPNTTKVANPAEQPLLTDAQLEFLNPTRVDGSTVAPKHPLTGEPLNPAMITISNSDEPSIKPTNPVQEQQPKAPAQVVAEESVKSATKLAFVDRLDMKKAFESGFSETIERTEVPVEQPIKTPTNAVVTDAQPETAVKADPIIEKAETFQLPGTDAKATTLLEEMKESTVTNGEKSVAEVEAKPLTGEPVRVAESRAAKLDSEGRPESALDSEKLNRQIADKAQTFLAFRREGALTIHLEPRELGQITMSVKMENGNVSTEIKASNQQVAQSLEANKQDFVRQVESRGLSLGSFSVGMSNQGQSGNGQQQTANHQDFTRQANISKFFTTSTSQPSAALATTSVSSGRGLDYLI